MCLIIFDWQPSEDKRLTLASNRDEFHNRPSADAHFWQDQSHIYGGRDLKENGTWLAVSKRNRFAAVTNYRSPETEIYQRSRGEIPSQFLCSTLSATDFAAELSERKYSGFNALLFDGNQLVYCTNRYSNDDSSFEYFFKCLPAGQYGLSNHLLDTPWHKIKCTKPALLKVPHLSGNKEISDILLSTLQNKELAKDEDLPKTGISESVEKLLSPVFIAGPNYGTRTSTALIMTKQETYFQERQYKGDCNYFKEQSKYISHIAE